MRADLQQRVARLHQARQHAVEAARWRLGEMGDLEEARVLLLPALAEHVGVPHLLRVALGVRAVLQAEIDGAPVPREISRERGVAEDAVAPAVRARAAAPRLASRLTPWEDDDELAPCSARGT